MTQDTHQKITAFFTKYPMRTFDKRELLIRADDDQQKIFYITEGRVSQYDITPSGNEVVVNVFKPGAFFPMSTALNATPNPYFFEASTKVQVHVVPAADAVQFLENNPDVTLDLLARVYRGVDGILRRMAHLMGGDAHTRLLFEIINAAHRFGEQQEDGSIHIPLQEGDLARHSGLARETVNRSLRDLKAAQVIRVTRNGMTVQSVEKLESLLGSIV